VFDEWGNGIIGDGTNARQHWISPLAGAEVDSRKTLQPVFDNEGMRPAVGSEFLMSRHLPEDVQGQFIYACVINMHGMPRFNLRDSEAGYEGERIADLLSSTDQMFRPVDPKVGPDGAIWFGDWCNALIGHMQYSQRDPNRDHTHGRVYRMIYEGNPLIEPVSYDGLSVAALLEELSVPELRTRYRIRREIREHTKADVLAAVESFVQKTSDPMQLCEAMWAQESFDAVSPELLDRLLRSEDFHARSAAMHVIGNQRDYLAEPLQWLERGIADAHPRVRLEAIRGLSFFNTNEEALGIMLAVTQQPMDYWIEYTLEHALNAFEPMWQPGLRDEDFVARFPAESIAYVSRHQKLTGPGGFAVKPLETADDVDAAMGERLKAIGQLSNLGGGNAGRGEKVYTQVCSACHMVGDLGKKFGPDLSDIGSRMSSKDIVTSIILPNDQIAKGYETVMVVTEDAEVISGFILSEDDQNLNLGIANGKEVSVEKELIVERKAMKASSMPEGLAKTIAPIEFLDLLVYLTSQKGVNKVTYDDDWFGAKSVKPAPLRANGDLVEISRDAKIKFGKGFDSWNPWNKQTYLLLQPLGISEFDFAFHSTHSVAEPNILIEMPESAPPVEKIWLKNRLTSQFHSRAEGLTVWSSMDGKKFDKVWTAEKPADEYWIDLSGKSPAKFFRIGLEGEGTFHLYQAAFFGNP
jgi:putative heme-binding domain-containing protein